MKLFALSATAVLSAQGALAATPAEMAALADALQISEIVEVMREEGTASAGEIAEAFQIREGGAWMRELNAIYDAEIMEEIVIDGMADAFGEYDPSPITAFYTSELGARIIELEISARIAFMDEAIEEASNEAAARLPQTDPDRFAQLESFVEVNNLIDSNVVGALNSNYAFMQALSDAGGLGDTLTESQLLNEVYAQEPEIRQETGRWLYSYLSLAYQPLSDEEMELYLDFSRSESGQAMNRALFEGFDDMFVTISRALGELVGDYSASEEL